MPKNSGASEDIRMTIEDTSLEIEERRMLPDRIQLSNSIRFFNEKNYQDKIDYDNYRESTLLLLRNKDIPKSFHHEKRYLIKDNAQRKQYTVKVYYAEIPESYYKDLYPYISHVRLRLDPPYTFTLEFNFIKYLKQYVSGSTSYDKSYNDSILIEDTNYIDDRIWHNWNNDFIKNLIAAIPTEISQFSGTLAKRLIPGFDQEYITLTIKQIEFNKDYYVGSNRAAEIQHRLVSYLSSYEGIDWLRGLTVYCVNSYKVDENKLPVLNHVGDLTCPTVKYFLADGLQFKLYRKTTDHVRLELTIYGNYILKKLKKQSWDFVLHKLFHIGKEFFRKTQFKQKIQIAFNQSYNDKYAYLDEILNYTYLHYPELNYIFDCLMHKTPVKDKRVIEFIKSNRSLYSYYQKTYNKADQEILIYKGQQQRRKVTLGTVTDTATADFFQKEITLQEEAI
jgi:hypothetical protein